MRIKAPKHLIEQLNNKSLEFTVDDCEYEIVECARKNQIKLRDRKKNVFVSIKSILYFYSELSHVYAYDGSKKYETILKLYELEELYGFVRINKAFIVNILHIKEMSVLPFGKIKIVLRNGDSLEVSRSYNASFKQFIERWVY